jgi:hypothetical protein
MTERFPYKASRWGQSDAERQFWAEGLERFGPEAIRSRLAQDTRRADEPLILTHQLTPPIGFAWEWLNWHDERKAAAEEMRQERMLEATQASARATEASAYAAVAAVLSLFASGVQVFLAFRSPPLP